MKDRMVKKTLMFFTLLILSLPVIFTGCSDNKGKGDTGANTESMGESNLLNEDVFDDMDSKEEEDESEGEAEEKTEVRREDFPDCDGSGHGYVEIHYSDGSTEIEEY